MVISSTMVSETKGKGKERKRGGKRRKVVCRGSPTNHQAIGNYHFGQWSVLCVCEKRLPANHYRKQKGPNQCGCSCCCRPLSHLMNTTGRETDLLCQHTKHRVIFTHCIMPLEWNEIPVAGQSYKATAGNSVHSSHTISLRFLPGNNICIAHTQSICAVQMRYLHQHHHHWVFLSVSPSTLTFPSSSSSDVVIDDALIIGSSQLWPQPHCHHCHHHRFTHYLLSLPWPFA